MDYLNIRNISADTEMRGSISGSGQGSDVKKT
jgi:uncharacterized protein YqfA (UPF0365 family)